MKGKVLMGVGLVMLLAALALAGFNTWDEARAEGDAAELLAQLELPAETEPLPAYILHPHMEMPTLEVDGRQYIGVVSIPSLGIQLPVLSQWSEDGARTAPCRYEGSAYTDDLIIAGHNYRSHFGSLKNVGVGDLVCFTDAEGHVFRHTVAQVEVLDGSAVEEMSAGDWDLTLFTCTYGGQARVTVRCT